MLLCAPWRTQLALQPIRRQVRAGQIRRGASRRSPARSAQWFRARLLCPERVNSTFGGHSLGGDGPAAVAAGLTFPLNKR